MLPLHAEQDDDKRNKLSVIDDVMLKKDTRENKPFNYQLMNPTRGIIIRFCPCVQRNPSTRTSHSLCGNNGLLANSKYNLSTSQLK